MPSISGNGLRGMAAIAVAIGSSATSVFAAEPFGVAARDIYIVQLADPPAAALNPGAKVDTEAPATQVYVAKLLAAQSAVAAAAGLANKIYSYTYTVNGFAIELTAQQAAKLARAPGVIAVTKDEIQQIDTATTPAFLGLTGPGGFYARTGGVKGENVIIGVLDTGIWPDHPSLSPAGFGPPPAKWKGSCQTGTGFTAANCNNKLLGARYFNAGFGGDAGVLDKLPYEYTSPKDAVGHGTHTLTTAGGNEGVVIPTSAALAALRTASGIAPRARVAAYKVCWGRPAQSPGVAGCKTVDAVAAIEQAVVDGVDVINFSIGGSRSSVVDPLQAAFRSAASAGVFVAVSAGNSGQAPTGETPILQTVAHLSPWVTTVAASTHNRETSATLTLGNGASYTGAALAPIAVPPGTAMILGSDAAAAGKGVIEAGYCFASFNPGGLALDRAKVAGKIVVCEHSPIQPYFSPSFAVWEAGGIGMVLINTAAAPLHDDPHRVPWVHLEHTDRTAVRDYAGGANPTASISAATVSPSTGVAPVIADFSSRGPNLNVALHWDQLKPDLTAPGVNILAGTSPDGDFGQLFWQKDGTSMASPHVAGLAALFKQAHPTWSPMAIKSALMTTAIDLVGMSNSAPLTLWSQGPAMSDRPQRFTRLWSTTRDHATGMAGCAARV